MTRFATGFICKKIKPIHGDFPKERISSIQFCDKIQKYELLHNSQYQKNFTLQKNFPKHKSDFSFTELYYMRIKSILQKDSPIGE
jgi:hypothetical protein